MPDDSPPLDALLDEIQDDVARRRQATPLAPGVEASLAGHDERVRGDEDPLTAAVHALGQLQFTRSAISHESARPGGAFAHDLIGKAVGREIEGVLEQTRMLGEAVQRIAVLLAAELRERNLDVLQQVDDLQARIVEQQRQLDELRHRA